MLGGALYITKDKKLKPSVLTSLRFLDPCLGSTDLSPLL